MLLKKLKRLAAVLMLTAVALSVTFASAGIQAYADTYTKTEKSMSNALAKYVVDNLKRPSSFQIVKIE